MPQRMLDGGRLLIDALLGPICAAVMLIIELWIGAAVLGAASILAWTPLLTVNSRNVPQRGPCARPE